MENFQYHIPFHDHLKYKAVLRGKKGKFFIILENINMTSNDNVLRAPTFLKTVLYLETPETNIL